MKQRQYITTFSLIVALIGLSPVVADAGRTSDGERAQPDQKRFESTLGYKLSPEQMDKVHAGISPVTPVRVLPQDMYGDTMSWEAWMNWTARPHDPANGDSIHDFPGGAGRQ